MKDKSRFVDSAKNILILLLLISAVFLIFKAVLYEPDSMFADFFSRFSDNREIVQPDVGQTSETILAAKPVYVLVTTEDGSHYAVKYSSQDREKMLSQFSSALGEALGSSSSPAEISLAKWQQALGGSGVFFDYLYPQPLWVIAISLGTDVKGIASSDSARRLFLGNENGNLMLYYISAVSGKIFRCETALSFSTLASKISEYPMGNAKFAFELGGAYENLDPFFIFSGETCDLRAAGVSNPLHGDYSKSALLNVFGINIRAASEYSEADGSIVYVEGEKSLRIESSGRVLFNVTGKSGIPVRHSSENLTINDCLSACSEIVRTSVGGICGDAELGIADIDSSKFPSEISVNFRYFLDGLPVILPNGSYAASFSVDSGFIKRAEFYFRQYSLSGDALVALPEKQAAAIVMASGGEPVLVYEDKADSVSYSWIVK